jgi:hypothetical protein
MNDIHLFQSTQQSTVKTAEEDQRNVTVASYSILSIPLEDMPVPAKKNFLPKPKRIPR